MILYGSRARVCLCDEVGIVSVALIDPGSILYYGTMVLGCLRDEVGDPWEDKGECRLHGEVLVVILSFFFRLELLEDVPG